MSVPPPESSPQANLLWSVSIKTLRIIRDELLERGMCHNDGDIDRLANLAEMIYEHRR